MNNDITPNNAPAPTPRVANSPVTAVIIGIKPTMTRPTEPITATKPASANVPKTIICVNFGCS